MNKIKILILALLFQACYIDDVFDIEKDIYVIPETMCDCVYYDNEMRRWSKIELRPGQHSFGWVSYSRKDYCEQVMEGYLVDC